MSSRTITVDVREDIRNGREPFSRIMAATVGLRSDDQLLLIAPFEPKPLFAVLAKQGFTHSAKILESGDWEVLFTRLPNLLNLAPQPKSTLKDSRHEFVSAHDDRWEVDARGLEPPQPLVRILETLAALPAGAELRARTDRRPMHLYPQLEQRGFIAETEEQTDGSFLLHIRHA